MDLDRSLVYEIKAIERLHVFPSSGERWERRERSVRGLYSAACRLYCATNLPCVHCCLPNLRLVDSFTLRSADSFTLRRADSFTLRRVDFLHLWSSSAPMLQAP